MPRARLLVALRASVVVGLVAWLGACGPSPDEPPVGESWCGLADDLPCCPGSSGVPPADMSALPSIAPVPEPVRAADDETLTFVQAGATEVAALWRGVTDSGDTERPSRVTLEVASTGTLRFDFARAVADFPAVVDGAEVRLSAAINEWGISYTASQRRSAVRLTRADGSLLAVVGDCDGYATGVLLSPILAPFAGQAGDELCREPTPTWPPGSSTWCYIGRTNRELVLDGAASPIAPGETARVSVGGAMFDFTNHRLAVQDYGGPHTTGGCLPAIPALCALSAYAVPTP